MGYRKDVKNIKLILVVGFVIVACLVFYLFNQHRTDRNSGFYEPAMITGVKAAARNSNSQVRTDDSTTDKVGLPNPEDAASTQQKQSHFSAFIKEEAKALDRTNNQTEAKTIELRSRALRLDANEKNHLKNISINSSLPVNERILSVYILTLAADIASQNLVSEIAQTPMPDLGPINPHSEAEVKNAQELALRYMAIDKLVENFKSNPPQSELAVAAMQSLQNQATQNPIPQVRKYANDELNKLTK